MGKQINLESFIEIYDTTNKNLIQSFVKLADNNFSYGKQKGMSDLEVNDLATFSKKILPVLSSSKRNGFFIGYVVSTGIREEFDILRFSNNSVLNVELKHKVPSGDMERVKNQLIRHRFLLGLLKKEIIVCTFISELDKIYILNDENQLTDISVEQLSDLISDDYLIKNELLNLNLSQLIINPYSQSEEFSNHSYFLTDEQKEISNLILRSSYTKICLTGGPGTGKSLLLFDLAKEYQQRDLKVLVLFCASMPNNNEISEKIGIRILPIRSINYVDFDEYDVILIDEAQRLYELQYNKLIELQEKILIFSTDHQQTLHGQEKSLNIENKLILDPEVLTARLKNKVRTDAPMASFILKFLNLKAEKVQPYNYTNVHVVYFNDKEKACNYIDNMCTTESYVSIELTEYITKSNRITKRKNISLMSQSSHSVIGREYDNVLVPLDKYFTYSEEGKLISTYSSSFYYPYHEDSCIFEALTRVKNNLLLVVIDNPSLYIKIQEILSWKNDKVYAK